MTSLSPTIRQIQPFYYCTFQQEIYTVDQVVSDRVLIECFLIHEDMPIKVQMKVTYTEPGLKGDTATNTLKPATVESGATVRVPLFISEGETIEIDTRDGSYVGRVKA